MELDLEHIERVARQRQEAGARVAVRPEVILAMVSHIRELESASQPGGGEAEKIDAERWRTAIRFIGAQYNGYNSQEFKISYYLAVGAGNLMKGSVAEHFTNAIDRERAKNAAPSAGNGGAEGS